MSAELVKAARVRAPFNGLTEQEQSGPNTFGVRKYTAGTTHAANLIPNAWRGQWLELYVTGGNLHYGFSIRADAEIDGSVVATAAGGSIDLSGGVGKVGGFIPDGEVRHVYVPVAPNAAGSTPVVYFVREASANDTVVYMRLAS